MFDFMKIGNIQNPYVCICEHTLMYGYRKEIQNEVKYKYKIRRKAGV